MHRAAVIVVLFLLTGLMAGCGPKNKGEGPPPAPEGKTKTGGVTQALSPEDEAKLKLAVAEGDALYDEGIQLWNESKKPPYTAKPSERFKKFDAASDKYMILVNAPNPLPDRNVMARVYGRVIDNALGDSKKNKSLAKEVALKALRQDILPLCKSSDASSILSAARRELKAEDKELDDWLEKEEKKGSGTKGEKAAATAEDLKKLGYDEIVRRLGEPDEEYRSKKKANMGLAIWETGDNQYTVVSFIEAIDGSGQTLVLTVHDKRSKSIVENMKRTLDNPK